MFCSVSRIFQADVNDAGHHHGEHEQDAAEQLQTFVEGHGAGIAQKLPVRHEHLVLLGRDPHAGLDDRLAARDGDGDGAEHLYGLRFAALAGFAVIHDIGGHAVAEDAEEREGQVVADALARRN